VTLVAEQAAPGWLPFALLAIPVVIMLLVGVPALRRRMAVRSEDHGPKDGPPKRIGPAWKVPYGLGASLTPTRAR
jgi:hypothetical protein